MDAEVAVRLKTNSNRIVFRSTFVDLNREMNAAEASPEGGWERSRPPYIDLCRDGKYASSVPARILYTEPEVAVNIEQEGPAVDR